MRALIVLLLVLGWLAWGCYHAGMWGTWREVCRDTRRDRALGYPWYTWHVTAYVAFCITGPLWWLGMVAAFVAVVFYHMVNREPMVTYL